MPEPENVFVSDEADATLNALAVHTRLGRGRLLEIAIQRLGESVVQADPDAVLAIAEKRDSRTVIDIAKDELELPKLSGHTRPQ